MMEKNFLLIQLCVLLFVGHFLSAQKILEKYNLPTVLEETSGLTMCNDTLWTHNDSGNGANLFAISPKGTIIAKRKLHDNRNIDWEDITIANGNLVVADMGNNFGTRKNLYLLEIAISADKTSVLDSIPFHYPEQRNFGFQQATPFDAEGIVYVENKIVVFTKNKSALTTEVYVIPPMGGAATKMGSLPVGSMITGADYHQDSNTLALTGYHKDENQHLYVINNFSLSTITDAKINQYDLDFDGAQIEAVSIIDVKTIWVTSEKTRKYPPFLAKIKLP